MKLKGAFLVMLLFLALIIEGSPALALDPIPQQSGFSGFVQPGAGYLNMKTNMVSSVAGFELSDKRINNLNDEPDSESTGMKRE